MDRKRVAALIHELLIEIGEDPAREGLKQTPARAAKAWEYLTSGYRHSLTEVINGAVFESEANNMIIVRDIEVYSLCEHHMLPFYGKVHIGYIARDKVLGVSKLARIADVYGRRLADTGTLYPADCPVGVGRHRRRRSRSCDGGQAPLHDDAGSGEAELCHDYLLGPRKLS